MSKLHYAARNGDIPAVKLLLDSGTDTNVKDIFGWTPLHYACFKGQTEAVNLLLDAGADANAEDADGWTPLHRAARCGRAGAVRLLLSAGADANAEDMYGWTPLHHACFKGQTEAVELLLHGSADANAEDIDGWTPLHRAARCGRTEAVRLLLSGGADANAKDIYGWTPGQYASSRGHAAVKALLDSAPIPLAPCAACGNQISTLAVTCPRCGNPVHPLERSEERVSGWNWGAFYFCAIWMAFHGMGNWAAAYFAATAVFDWAFYDAGTLTHWAGGWSGAYAAMWTLHPLISALGVVGWTAPFVLGANGNHWAWKFRQFRDVQHFRDVERTWSGWALGLFISTLVLPLIATLLVSQTLNNSNQAGLVVSARGQGQQRGAAPGGGTPEPTALPYPDFSHVTAMAVGVTNADGVQIVRRAGSDTVAVLYTCPAGRVLSVAGQIGEWYCVVMADHSLGCVLADRVTLTHYMSDNAAGQAGLRAGGRE